MWYQVSAEQADIIAGALGDKRYHIERALQKGEEWPFYTRNDMVRELSLVMELRDKFLDGGRLSLPLDSTDNHMIW